MARLPARAGSRGFTVVELIFSVTIAGVLLSSAVPSFRKAVLDSRRAAAVNEMLSTLQYARLQAISQGRTVIVCPSRDGVSCYASASNGSWDWTSGWLVFVNTVGSMTTPAVEPGDAVLRYFTNDQSGIAIKANQKGIAFRTWNIDTPTAGTITFCDPRSAREPAYARAIVVSTVGRPRVSTRSGSNEALVCP